MSASINVFLYKENSSEVFQLFFRRRLRAVQIQVLLSRMSPLVNSLIFVIMLAALVTCGRKNERTKLAELFLQPRQTEPCSRRPSSEYSIEDDLDDKVMDYLQNAEKFDSDKDEHKDQLSNLLSELRMSAKKRSGGSASSCDCSIRNGLIDLGYAHFPRYLISTVCQGAEEQRTHHRRCWRGSRCKPVEYKVEVLTKRGSSELLENDITATLLPDSLRNSWKFKTIAVNAGCYCSLEK